MVSRLVFLAASLVLIGCGQPSAMFSSPPQESYYTLSGGGAGIGPLSIRRAEVVFPNDRGDISVPLNTSLTARAVIHFDGSGMFQARWEVDGRTIDTIAINITFGNTLSLSMHPGVVLPTFEPGPHRVKLRIDQPAGTVVPPEVEYFVTVE